MKEPTERVRTGWAEEHFAMVNLCEDSIADVILLGASIIKNFGRYPNIWKQHFPKLKKLNFGIGGDKVENVAWRLKYGLLIPASVSYIILHVGTNNIPKDKPNDIADGLLHLTKMIHQRAPNAKIVLTGLLPRQKKNYIEKILLVNKILEEKLEDRDYILFLKPDDDWLIPNTYTLKQDYYYHDKLHLSELGYQKFASYIKNIMSQSSSISKSFPHHHFPILSNSLSTSQSLPTVSSSQPISSTCSPSLTMGATTWTPISSASFPLFTPSCTVSSVTSAVSSISNSFPTLTKSSRRQIPCRRRLSAAPSTLRYPTRLKFGDFRFFDQLTGVSKLSISKLSISKV